MGSVKYGLLSFFFPFLLFAGIQQPIDTLELYNLTDLYKKFESNEQNAFLANVYAKAFLIKAKGLRNKEYVCYGYYYLSKVSERNVKLNYLDSILEISNKEKSFIQFPELAFHEKANHYYDLRDFNTSLEVFLEGLEYAKKNEKPYYINKFKYYIGLIKSERVEQEKKALIILKEAYDYFAQDGIKEKESYDYLASIYAVADVYRKLGINDSATYFNRLGIIESQLVKDSMFSNYFTLSEGLNEYGKGEILSAIDSINSSLPILKYHNDIPNLSLGYYYLGKSYFDLNKDEMGFSYLNKMDSIFKETKVLDIEMRPGFEMLIKYYKGKKDQVGQLRAIEGLVYFDSMYITQYKEIRDIMDIKFDRVGLLNEREELRQSLSNQKKKSKSTLYIFLLVGIILTTSTIVYYLKQKVYKKRFKELIATVSSELVYEPKSGTDSLGVPEKIIEKILEELSNFEIESGFINPKINAHVLAEQLNTNTKYLSKVINEFKGKSIISYVNDLRIEFAIEKLKNDRRFRKYTIRAIAFEVGFNNPNSFSTAFMKRTQLKPSYFIQQISTTPNS